MHLLTGGCPRCGGTLSKVDDIGETYYSCVQCGHTVSQAVALRHIAGGNARGVAQVSRAA